MTDFDVFVTYHDANLEVELHLGTLPFSTEQMACEYVNQERFSSAFLHEDHLSLADGIIIKKEDHLKYQFRVCLCMDEKEVVSDEDYTPIGWDEAIPHLEKSSIFKFPFPLESYAFRVQKN